MAKKPIRLRDFVEDRDGWLYAVSVYDNRDRVGCVLRYVPDREGERVDREGRRYRKLDFDDAFKKIRDEKPEYADIVQRIPVKDIKRVFKPEVQLESIVKRISGFKNWLKSLVCLLSQSVSRDHFLLAGSREF